MADNAYETMTVAQLRTVATERELTFNAKTKKADLVAMIVASDESAEGLTTAELAVIFDTNAKALRVALRKLGLGVGRGRRYHLTVNDEFKTQVRDALAS